MDTMNALTIPRALATFPRKWLKAICQASDAVGDCVYVTGDRVGNLYQVAKADPRDAQKMPAVGIIHSKLSSTECKVIFLGELFGVYAGSALRKPVFVGVGGVLSDSPPTPLAGGYVFTQVMGTVVSSGVVVVVPNYMMVKRIG